MGVHQAFRDKVCAHLAEGRAIKRHAANMGWHLLQGMCREMKAKDIAKKMGVTSSYISDLKLRRKTITPEVYVKLCEIFEGEE